MNNLDKGFLYTVGALVLWGIATQLAIFLVLAGNLMFWIALTKFKSFTGEKKWTK